ncbi:UDP-glycosyltransferase UGT5-like [Anthonomus grandis grandis]|uniref:UDP-glycosyltransferase UGT5-like n=1 Tax=Anthonomus grandis grandis TaxID=2921223 RepID=UPI0021658262|nr:UDP-glycosyltransferase UGT5-like [Anthonomus grandis grandis]
MQLVLTIIVCLLYGKFTECSNILAVFPVAEKSSHVVYQKLLKTLADAGHEVTLISPYEYWENLGNGSVRDIVLTGFIEEYDAIRPLLYEISKSPGMFKHHSYMQAYLPIYNKTYQHPNLKWFLKSTLKFDVLITDNLYAPSLLGFGAIYQCPTIIFSPSIGANPLVTDILSLSSQWWNFYNFISYVYEQFFKFFHLFPAHGEILKRVQPSLDLQQLYHNVSLVLLGGPEASFPHSIANIGGFHLEPPEKVDLGTSKEIIYIHLEDLTGEEVKVLLKALQKIDLQVIWNSSAKPLANTPENVRFKSLPPQDVLGHANVKLLITNADYISLIEGVHHGKPSLVIPRTPVQLINAAEAEFQGYALKLIQVEDGAVLDAINQLMLDQKYSESARKVSKEFNTGKAKVVSWIEYVIKHQGASNHRGSSNWWLKILVMCVFGVFLWKLRGKWVGDGRKKKQ